MSPAPEGSEARIFARRQLLRMTMRALDDGRISVDEWIETLGRVFPQLVMDAGARDLRAIVAMCVSAEEERDAA